MRLATTMAEFQIKNGGEYRIHKVDSVLPTYETGIVVVKGIYSSDELPQFLLEQYREEYDLTTEEGIARYNNFYNYTIWIKFIYEHDPQTFHFLESDRFVKITTLI